ncbi:hypothetical protein P152DRAFT_511266 [Eremomyces bilateralis CBS 781.70]|uniref:Uncharacterized protein n=1 Tax=Eremomyces bilateralis CBS 781.70 TaxID=1392243 RepID=A0A6G1GER6_9PEZI|nr:uncharacterized protein P152DRAFT_511266 [Eremomyces bilateralis CBS 781.70]KAF1816502.1 hypothetical protein P152DRAFT_511266 [Eremomyces bilateralis CBS 781.70]
MSGVEINFYPIDTLHVPQWSESVPYTDDWKFINALLRFDERASSPKHLGRCTLVRLPVVPELEGPVPTPLTMRHPSSLCRNYNKGKYGWGNSHGAHGGEFLATYFDSSASGLSSGLSSFEPPYLSPVLDSYGSSSFPAAFSIGNRLPSWGFSKICLKNHVGVYGNQQGDENNEDAAENVEEDGDSHDCGEGDSDVPGCLQLVQRIVDLFGVWHPHDETRKDNEEELKRYF